MKFSPISFLHPKRREPTAYIPLALAGIAIGTGVVFGSRKFIGSNDLDVRKTGRVEELPSHPSTVIDRSLASREWMRWASVPQATD